MKKLEELPMREYLMYALGASHAQNFEEFEHHFAAMFLFEPCDFEKDDKAEDNEL